MSIKLIFFVFFPFFLCLPGRSISQAGPELLLNGDFEEINTCTEYESECGVEAWFYLKDVRAQMISQEIPHPVLGQNSLQIYYNWKRDPGFTPVLGSLLPCRLKPGARYRLRGMISARLNPRLLFKPAVILAPRYFVPGRAYSKAYQADTLNLLIPLNDSGMYQFEYLYTARGDEDYFTLGSFVSEDETGGKKNLTGVQTIGLTLDNFSLVPLDPAEARCAGYEDLKQAIYQYNYRHKQMDYPLYATGQIKLEIPLDDIRRQKPGEPAIGDHWRAPELTSRTDTITLTDISFDFNKADLKDSTRERLSAYFTALDRLPDSIRVEGHTDSLGSDQYNLQLSGKRSREVAAWIRENSGGEEIPLVLEAYGRSRPVDTNRSAAGRARNRRVVLILYWQE